MTTIMTRLYPSAAKAKAASDALVSHKFSARDIDIFTVAKGKQTANSIKSMLSKARVYPGAAETYSKRVANGDSLLVLRAPIGSSVLAKDVLDEFESIDAGVQFPDHYVGTEGRLYPSEKRTRHLPTLMPNNTLFLTNYDARPMRGTFSSFLGMPLLSKRGGRAKLITKNVHPFSSMFKLPLLSEKRRRRARA